MMYIAMILAMAPFISCLIPWRSFIVSCILFWIKYSCYKQHLQGYFVQALA